MRSVDTLCPISTRPANSGFNRTGQTHSQVSLRPSPLPCLCQVWEFRVPLQLTEERIQTLYAAAALSLGGRTGTDELPKDYSFSRPAHGVKVIGQIVDGIKHLRQNLVRRVQVP